MWYFSITGYERKDEIPAMLRLIADKIERGETAGTPAASPEQFTDWKMMPAAESDERHEARELLKDHDDR
jgi:hypothetical protein